MKYKNYVLGVLNAKYLLFIIILFQAANNQSQAQNKNDNKYLRSSGLFSIREISDIKMKTYISHIENAFLKISEIQAEISIPENFQKTENMVSMIETLKTIDSSFKLKTPINPKDLQLYLKILKNADEQRDRIKRVNSRSDTLFRSARKSLYEIADDTILKEMADELGSKNIDKLQPLRRKWQNTDSIIAEKIKLIDEQSMQLSVINIKIKDLQRQSTERLFESNITSFKKTDLHDDNKEDQKISLSQSKISTKIVGLYIKENLFLFTVFPIITIFTVYWWTRRKIQSVKDNLYQSPFQSYLLHNILTHPFANIFFLAINLIPLLDINTPSFYHFFIVLLSVTMFFYLLHRKQRRCFIWYCIGSLLIYLAIMICNNNPSTLLYKVLLSFINVAVSILVSYVILKEELLQNFRRRYRIIAFLSIILMVFSLACILVGRMLIAYNITYATIVCILQLVTLFIVKGTFLNLLKLQMIHRRVKLHYENHVDTSRMEKNLTTPLNLVIYFFCTAGFINNLNLLVAVESIIDVLMSMPINIGSIHITAGSIIYFVFIVLLAHFLKNHIGYVFGKTGIEEEDDKFEQSSLVITRLLIICLGYVIAVAASGLPVDKITIVLGALSVGVGMGFQNIVNNFISGIILLFERPLKIGDNVQVNGRSGRVKEMGVRTSTLQTDEGAEIIIPNGTILSEDITNWSYTNNRRRIELPYNIETEIDPLQLEQSIVQIFEREDSVLPFPKPSVLFDEISNNTYKIRIHFWLKDSGNVEQIKSSIKSQLFYQLHNKNIHIR
ncbi:Mechanosensitive ion channel [Chryseobacterium soldanellicola]|uniref:Mechanosensitive ion channel n=1 Tax=Chryseobacterium soldanellicola TaxID=311333 RepID=A0A1H1FCM1_9FLAO|nr:mechanosensitive ion channel domain-containing protein [Chryseobacterium soldanellicola]SDQ98640.1 Mechanosensitive ion channel [Chryseobacterium soldanellicola]